MSQPQDKASPEAVQAAIQALRKAQADYAAKIAGATPARGEEKHTFYFAPEIEEALVSFAWHEPERLASVYRELDPALHITQPHLRWLLEAIDLTYRDLGCVNFEVVIQALRETGHLEDCGGLDGASHVYGLEEFGRDDAERNQKIFKHYLSMLKTYAVHRAGDPHSVTRFTNGELYLSVNKTKTKDSDPDLVGHGNVAGRSYKAAAWVTTNPQASDSVRVSLLPSHG
jgi:hypothetical protein